MGSRKRSARTSRRLPRATRSSERLNRAQMRGEGHPDVGAGPSGGASASLAAAFSLSKAGSWVHQVAEDGFEVVVVGVDLFDGQ